MILLSRCVFKINQGSFSFVAIREAYEMIAAAMLRAALQYMDSLAKSS